MKHKNECSAARPESLNNISFLTSWLTFFVFWIFFVTTFYLFLPVNPSFSSRTFSGGLTNGHRIQIISPGYYTCSILLSFRMFENLTLKNGTVPYTSGTVCWTCYVQDQHRSYPNSCVENWEWSVCLVEDWIETKVEPLPVLCTQRREHRGGWGGYFHSLQGQGCLFSNSLFKSGSRWKTFFLFSPAPETWLHPSLFSLLNPIGSIGTLTEPFVLLTRMSYTAP